MGDGPEAGRQGLDLVAVAHPHHLAPAIVAATTFSRVGAGQPAHAPAQPLLPSLRRVMGDVAFRLLLGVFVANGIAAALPATLFLFFVADVLQLERASGPLLAVYFVAGAASLPLSPPRTLGAVIGASGPTRSPPSRSVASTT